MEAVKLKMKKLTYQQTLKLHRYLEENVEALKDMNHTEIAELATRTLECPVSITSISKLNKDFNLGLRKRESAKSKEMGIDELRKELEQLRKEQKSYNLGIDLVVKTMADDIAKLKEDSKLLNRFKPAPQE